MATAVTPATKATPATTRPSRNCIVAMDGSDHADYALDWFCENVHSEGDHVIIVYVPELHDVLHSSRWTPTVYQFERDVLEGMVKEEHDRIKAKLDVFADKLKQHKLGGKVESFISKKPGEGIVKAAESEKADIIILGSRGQGQLRRTFMGSVSDYVVHHSHVPVLVCKHPSKHIPGHPHPDPHKKDHSSHGSHH